MIGVGELLILISAISLFIGPIERSLAQFQNPDLTLRSNAVTSTILFKPNQADVTDDLMRGIAATAATFDAAAAETPAHL